ncbi:MAG: hypothetical protein ACI30I_04210 [Parabacteroides sp.]
MDEMEILIELQEIQRHLYTKCRVLEMAVSSRPGSIYYSIECDGSLVTAGFFYGGAENRTQNRYGIYAFRQTVQKLLDDIKDEDA